MDVQVNSEVICGVYPFQWQNKEASWKKGGFCITKDEVLFFILCVCLGLTTNYTGNWKACISGLNILYQQAQVPWNVRKLSHSPDDTKYTENNYAFHWGNINPSVSSVWRSSACCSPGELHLGLFLVEGQCSLVAPAKPYTKCSSYPA